MSGRSKKKARDQVINKMFDKKISVDEARTRYGGKYGKQPPAVAARPAAPSLRQVMQNHSDPQVRESAVVVKSLQAGGDAPPAAPRAPRWTPLDTALLRESREHPDPARRDTAYRALEQRGVLGWAPPGGDRQVQISVPPDMQGHLQLPGGLVI
jgi:hypothetical protein